MANDVNETESTVNVNDAVQTAWIVYINGIEVPVHSVNITSGVWTIPQAEIVMVPDPVIQRLGADDRVTVQVFYCDQWIRPNRPEFRLLFDGEIIGWSYVNLQRARSISFTAVDYAQIFTQLFFFFMSSITDMAKGALDRQIGVTANGVELAGLQALFPYSLFAQGLVQSASDEKAELISRPIDYVYNVVRGLTENIPNISVPAANFFGPWARRTNFHKRFVALPYLEDSENPGIFPILRAVQADFAVSAVADMTAQMGTAGSIWQVFKEVLSTLMMEFSMNPAPAAVRGDSVSLDIYGSAQAQSPAHLTSYFVKPQFLFGIPPACNVFFPSQITQLGYEENYATQPTRMYFNDDSWTQFLNSRTNTPALQTAVRTALTVAHPEEVNLVLQHSLNDPKYNGKNLLVYPEEFYRGPVIDRRVMPRWFLFLKKAQDQGGTTNVETLSEDEQIDLLREVLPGDSARNIYRKYAAYEYAKERYSRRNGGIQMPFNPYPIAGFPCAVMDRRSTEVDVFGYVMNVQHTLSTRAMTTHVSFSYGRTFQEAFALLKKQVDLENLVINRERAAIARKINETGTPYDLRENMERVGPIAVAPAEPIREIRDVIQNFDRAEAFYQALLYRAQPPSADELTQQQEQAEIVRRADAEENFVIAPAALSTISETEVDQYLRNKDASFQYHKIIQLQKLSGKKEDIKITGIDSTTRIKLISIIDKMREGTATDSELTLIRNALVQPDLAQQGEVQDATLDQRLNVIEEEIQNTLTSTNITGDVSITPKQSARRLFSSYSSALFYNARPICTLDEYLLFLGESADPQGKTTPQTALANNASRTFPATFYERIRTYRPGPPADLPTTNISNTSVYTSPDGVYVVDLTSQDLEPVPATDGSENNVAGIPEDFPETSQDWDAVLLVYRNNVLNREPPGR